MGLETVAEDIREDARDVGLQFDAVDELGEEHSIAFGVRNKWQTRRVGEKNRGRVHELVNIGLETEYDLRSDADPALDRIILDADIELVEWAEVHGALYGTPRSNLRRAREADRYRLANTQVPAEPYISEPMQADLHDNYGTIRTLLSMLGFPILENLKAAADDEHVLFCRGKDADARGEYVEDGFVVFVAERTPDGLRATARPVEPSSEMPSGPR